MPIIKLCNDHRLHAFKAKAISRWPNQLVRQKGRVISGRSCGVWSSAWGLTWGHWTSLCLGLPFLGSPTWGLLLVVALRMLLEPVKQLKQRGLHQGQPGICFDQMKSSQNWKEPDNSPIQVLPPFFNMEKLRPSEGTFSSSQSRSLES